MHITDFGKQFFLFMFAAVAVCTVIALTAQFISRGKTGTFGKVIVALAAAAGSFLSLHRNDIGKFTREEWLRHMAIASIIVETFVITLLSLGIAESVYKRIRREK